MIPRLFAQLAKLAAIAALAGLLPGAAAGQTLRAWDHGSYGRLVFDWNGPAPGMDWQLDGRTMVIEGEQVISRDVAYFLDFLARYIADIRLEADGRRVVIELTAPMTVEQLRLNDRWAWDFRLNPDAPVSAPDQFAGQRQDNVDTGDTDTGDTDTGNTDAGDTDTGDTDAGDTAASQDSAGDGSAGDGSAEDGTTEDVAVEGGPAPASEAMIPVFGASRLGYSRVVLEFESAPDYAVRRRGDTIEVAIERPVTLDLSDVQAGILPEIFGLQQHLDGDATSLLVATLPGSEVRHFLSSGRIVLDILAPNSGYRASEIEIIEPGTPATVRVEPLAGAETDGAADGGAQAGGAQAGGVGAGGVEAGDVQVGDAGPDSAGSDAAGSSTAESDGAGDPGEDTNDAAETANGQAGPAGSGEADGTTALAGAADDQGPAPQASPPAPVDADAMASEAVFDTGQPMGLAVFRRGGDLWLVFANAANDLNSATLAEQGETGFGVGIPAEARGGVAIRYADYDGADPVLRQEDTAWRVLVPAGAGALAATGGAAGIAVEAEPDHPDGGRVLIADLDSFGPVAFIDPSVGDILVAMAPRMPAGGLATMQRFIDFRLLPSIQGLVVRPAVEDLRVRPLDGGVQITAESGLDLS
ncbi:MAG: hypothetical protein RLO50_09215 [Azospirillaceae bacterium]